MGWGALAPGVLFLFSTTVNIHHPTTKATSMLSLIRTLNNDEAGFIVSAELVLIATIAILGLVVGLSEVSLNVNNELEDVGSAFACIQQTYSTETLCGHKGILGGSSFEDQADFCDSQDNVQ